MFVLSLDDHLTLYLSRDMTPINLTGRSNLKDNRSYKSHPNRTSIEKSNLATIFLLSFYCCIYGQYL